MRKSLVAAALVASALFLSSCAMPADDPNYDPNAAVDMGDATAAASAAAGAEALVEASLAAPTSIGVETPLSKAPAKGALIVSLSDGTDASKVLDASMAEAAKTLGWEFKTVDGADTAENAPAAFEAALALKPAGIRISGDFVDSLTDGLAKAEAAGIPVVCNGCAGDPSGAIKDTAINGDAQNTDWGNLLSSYVDLKQMPGEDAGVELFTPVTPVVATFNQAFTDNLATLCHDCSTNQDDIDPATVSDVGSFVADTMSTSLGRWALIGDGFGAPGVSDAIAANADMLLAPVVVIGRGASAADIAALAALGGGSASGAASPDASAAASPEASASPDASSDATAGELDLGTQEQADALQAWVGIPLPVMGWRDIDQFARLIGGDAVEDGPLPSQLLTADTAGQAALDADGNYIGIADYQEQFKTLWGVK